MKKIILCLVAIFALTAPSLADSPLTSTEWWQYYQNKAVVKEAHDLGCTDNVVKVICNPSCPIDLRLAIVNALGWNIEGQHNFLLCIEHYKKANNISDDELDEHMSPETLCVFAYLLALDDYFNVDNAITIAAAAYQQKPTSRAIAMIAGLIVAQSDMQGDWCDVYTDVAQFAYDTNLTPDMSDYAVNQIMDYINLYESSCKQ